MFSFILHWKCLLRIKTLFYDKFWGNMTAMKSDMYDDLANEELIKEHFGMRLEIKKTLVRSAPVSHTSEATVFLSTKNQLYVLIRGQSRMKMGEVKKIISRMGLKAELFIPPKGQS